MHCFPSINISPRASQQVFSSLQRAAISQKFASASVTFVDFVCIWLLLFLQSAFGGQPPHAAGSTLFHFQHAV
jgi:hypothetical protein